MDLNGPSPSDVVDEPEPASAAVDDDRPESDGSSDPPATSSTESSTSRTQTIKDMLFATDPERDLDDVEAPYDPERGGLNRVYRGIQKMVDVDGLPAIADVVLGFAEWLDLADPSVDDDGESENSEGNSSESERPDDLEAALDEVKSA